MTLKMNQEILKHIELALESAETLKAPFLDDPRLKAGFDHSIVKPLQTAIKLIKGGKNY